MDDQILIGILRRLRWLEAHAVHYRIAEDGTAVLTWRGARSGLGSGGGGDVFLASANVFTQDNTFSSGGYDTLKLTASDSGILFGGDAYVYRVGAGTIAVQPNLYVAADLGVDEQIWLDQEGTGHRLYFGSAADVSLYRNAAFSLKTDGAFNVGNALGVANAIYMDTGGTGQPLYFGSAADVNLYRGAANLLLTDDNFGVSGYIDTAAVQPAHYFTPTAGVQTSLYTNTAGVMAFSRVGVGDRLYIDTVNDVVAFATNAGVLKFGASQDTNLYRSAANILQTDDALKVGEYVWLDQGNAGHRLYFGTSADVSLYRSAADTLKTEDSMHFVGSVAIDVTDISHKLYFGSAFDTNLYRSAANTLKTDDTLEVAAHLSVGNIARVDVAGTGSPLTFGSSFDTNLYRSGANALKTDDAFDAVGAITQNGTAVVLTTDTRVPTQGENDAGAGSAGTPSSTNRYVTMDDAVWDVFALAPGTSDIAHDASSNVAAGTGNLSWTHTPVGTPAAVVVQIAQTASVSDGVLNVSYGGVTMTRLSMTTDTTEAGAIYTYTLVHDIPTGAQTVLATVSGANSRRGVAHTVTSGKPVRVAHYETGSAGSSANPSVTIALPTAMESAVYGILYSGHDDVASLTAAAGYTEVLEHDFTSQTASWIRRTANTTGGDTTAGWTATAEDYAVEAVALTQVQPRNWGLITNPPTRAAMGDRMSIRATDVVTGSYVIWEFIFDPEPAASSFYWKYIGGAPIVAEDNDARTRNAATYAALATDPMTLTLPPQFSGDYDIQIGAGVTCAAGATAYLSYTIGATAASDTWAAKTNAAAAISASVENKTRQLGITGSTVISEQAKSSTGTSTFDNRRMSVWPVRIG